MDHTILVTSPGGRRSCLSRRDEGTENGRKTEMTWPKVKYHKSWDFNQIPWSSHSNSALAPTPSLLCHTNVPQTGPVFPDEALPSCLVSFIVKWSQAHRLPGESSNAWIRCSAGLFSPLLSRSSCQWQKLMPHKLFTWFMLESISSWGLVAADNPTSALCSLSPRIFCHCF